MPILTRFDITPHNGTARDAITFLKDQSLAIEPQLNGRMVVEVTFIDRLDRPNAEFDIFRPNKRDAFLIEFDDGTRYGGIVWDVVSRTHIIAGLPDAGLVSVLRLTDYNALLDVVPFNEPVASGTLKSQIEAIMSNLVVHGITLAADQADGPTLGPQIFDWRTARQVFDELSLQSTWVYRINADGEVRFIEPGSLTLATPITEADGNYRSIRLEDSLNDYRNALYLRYGPHGVLPFTEVFEGDGSTRTFVLALPLSVTGTGVTTRGVVTVTRTGPAVTEETIDADPVAGGAQWHYDVAATWNNALVHDTGETVLGVGETVSITYYAVYPGVAFAADEAEYEEAGPFISVIDRPDITDPALAATTVAAEVQRLAGDNARVAIETMVAGYEPGQTVAIFASTLGIQDSLLITEVRMIELANTDGQERTFVYQLVAIQGNVYRENWRAFFRQIRGEEGTGGTPGMPPSGCDGPVTWSDTFESASALSADYTVTGTPAKTPGAGPDGSQAVVFPTAAGTYRIARTGLTLAGRDGCLSMDVRFGTNAAAFLNVILGNATSLFVLDSLASAGTTGGGTFPPDGGVDTFYYNTVDRVTTAGGLFADSVYFNYRLEWRISTYVGPTINDHALDGYVRLYINDALVASAVNVKVGDNQGAQVVLDRLRIDGRDCTIDNLVIRGSL